MDLSSLIADLESQVADAEQQASASALSEDEAKTFALIERRREAKEAKADSDRKRRAFAMIHRENEAKASAGGKYLVAAVDLVDLLPELNPSLYPGDGGVIVVRSPSADATDAMMREIEAKSRPISAINADLVCGATVYPKDLKSEEGLRLRAFFDAYPGVALVVGDTVTELGGLRAKGTKRGRK